ncbi:MAG: hypothetical protein JNJ57_05560 [Saprospiraceae bacterium]|nr:hypothetical protein [Saprospiraceae bacterium]
MNNKILILILVFALILGINYSCSEEASLTPNEKQERLNASDRDITVLDAETFEMTSNNGNCYTVTLERMSDNSIRYSKVPTTCSSVASSHTGVYMTHMINPDINGKIKLDDGYTYWYIPLNGTQAMDISGGEIICFCEEQYVDEEQLCTGQGECNWVAGGRWRRCTEDPCCEDCDLRICIGGNVAGSLNIQNANGIIARSAFIRSVYYGSNTKIEISRQGNTIVATRSVISGTSYPRHLVNLTTLPVTEGKINIPSGGSFWFIPFESGIAAMTDPPDVSCVADGDCTKCEIKLGPTECWECFCTAYSTTPDCDMVINENGGVLVQATQVHLTDL